MLSGLLREMDGLLDDGETVGDSKVLYIFWSCLSGADKVSLNRAQLLRATEKQR